MGLETSPKMFFELAIRTILVLDILSLALRSTAFARFLLSTRTLLILCAKAFLVTSSSYLIQFSKTVSGDVEFVPDPLLQTISGDVQIKRDLEDGIVAVRATTAGEKNHSDCLR